MGESYYEVLDVSQDASEEKIEAAYREKVKEYHPDQSNDPNAREKFRQVREAKETLLDPKARQRYDRKRDSTVETGEENEQTQRESSEEWAREQRRQQRQQRQQQQAEYRQQRQQRQ